VLQEPVVLRKGRDVAAEAVVSAEAAQEAAAEIQAEEVLPKIARKGGPSTGSCLEAWSMQVITCGTMRWQSVTVAVPEA
jgi:hypothetical protein